MYLESYFCHIHPKNSFKGKENFTKNIMEPLYVKTILKAFRQSLVMNGMEKC
jgi:hypothetical protein